MLQDARFAFRLFAHQRGFFVTAILTIALGVGLSATVFAVVDGVLFRPLPYRDPSRLVAMYGAVRAEQQWTMSVSWPDMVDWRASAHTLTQIEGYNNGGYGQALLKGTDESTLVQSTTVSAGFLDMLGVQAAPGRTFVADDFKPGATPVAVISYRVWRGVFGGDPDVLGRTIQRGVGLFTVVGVLPRTFVFPAPRRFAPDVLVPYEAAGPMLSDRTARGIFLIGRLAPGASLKEAQTEVDAIALRLKPLFVGRPNSHPGAFDGATLMDLRYQLTRTSRPVLWLVFGAVGAVFLISCANVVGLLLAHGEDRRRELAVRTALGAGRWALVRQLLIEAALIATTGAAAGWLLSVATLGVLLNQIPRWLQLMGEPRMDARVGVFALAMTVLTLLFVGLVPAFRATTQALQAALASGSRAASGRQRGRHVILLVEVALATVLLCAGSIMLRGWMTLYSQDSGMDADRVIAVRSVTPGEADAVQRSRYNALVADALRRIPGVEAVAFVDMPLLQSAVKGSQFIPPARVRHPAGMDTDLTVSPNYFKTIGVPIRMGRGLSDADRGRGVVISESLARRYWPGRNPVGQTVNYGDGTRDIVGVAADARDVSFDRPPTPTLYHVWDEGQAPIATVLVRFSGPAARVMAGIRRAIRGADDRAAITMLSTVEDLLTVSVAERNFNTLLFGVFGLAGVAVALVGIYGLVSFVVARREREMGIRLALGASAGGLMVFIMSGTLRWIAAGLVCGIALALAFAQNLKPFVYQVPANDPWTLGLVAVAFLGVAAAASYIPARRAAHVDPMIALRAE
jgi:putative ABC transport system permease protein